MGCSGCGQKYRALQKAVRATTSAQPEAVKNKKVYLWKKGRRVMVDEAPKKLPIQVDLIGDGPNAPVHAMQDVIDSPSAPVPAYAVDPSTGFAVDVIKKGECAENDLGDTRAFPQTGITVTSVPPQDEYAGVKDASPDEPQEEM